MADKKPVSEAAKKAHRKYMESFVEIKVRMTPDKRAVVKDHAQAMGESTTAFINRAIDYQMQIDLKADNTPQSP